MFLSFKNTSANKIIRQIAKPIEFDMPYFILMFIAICPLEVYSGFYYHYLATKEFNWGIINLLSTGVVVSYCFSFILFVLPKKLKAIWKSMTMTLVALHFIGSVYLISMYGYVLNDDIISIIINSNKDEAAEYFSTYLSAKYFILLILALLMLFLVYWITKLISLRSRNYIIIVSILIVCTILTLRRPYYFVELFPLKYERFHPSNKVPELTDYVPEIIRVKDEIPQNIVIIIGESFSKSKSSLYGYSKNTNPYLTLLKEDSLLYVYDNVTSPSLSTIPCFKSIMSMYKHEYKDSVFWYECPTLPNVVGRLYNTYWISNQSKRGIHDNVQSRYADQCDINLFVGDKFASGNRKTYDLEIIPLLKSQMNRKNNFYFINLMGSHVAFKNRYPQSFEKFKPIDYKYYPEHQRENRAEYDNTILYNDFVVYEILKLFYVKEAIVFYFSDHGLDVYESSDDYIGHSKAHDSKSAKAGVQIPFMIFASPLYKTKYPEMINSVKQSISKPFCTDDLIYSIMDVIGIRFSDEKINGESLFDH